MSNDQQPQGVDQKYNVPQTNHPKPLPQGQVSQDPISEMAKSIRCLALELPEPVWRDVNERWQRLVKFLNVASPLPASSQTEVQKWRWVSASERLPVGSAMAVNKYTGSTGRLTVRKDDVLFELTDGVNWFYGFHDNNLYDNFEWIELIPPYSTPTISHKEDEKLK